MELISFPTYTCNLDKDINLPSLEVYADKADTLENHEDIDGKVYVQIMQIKRESPLLPCGLHTVSISPSSKEATAMFVNFFLVG